MKIPIKKFVNNWQTGDGVQRVIDNKGTIVNEYFNPDSVVLVWIG